jgi:hypothetical protein
MSRREDAQLRSAIHDVLIREWDPLSVGTNPLAQDEYDSYIPGVQRLLAQGCDAYKLTAYLDRLERVSMGLREGSGRGREVAGKLLAIRR